MTPKTQREPKLHAVAIRIDGKGFVYSTREHPDAKSIHVHPGDLVRWGCDHGNYSILFKDRTPFGDIGAHSHKGRQTPALEIIAEPGSYKYAVNVALPNGLVVDDPEIIVDDGGGT